MHKNNRDKSLPERDKNSEKPDGHAKDARNTPLKTEVKNAHAAGLGAIGRSNEKPDREKDDQMHY